jgi:hypothetical protein
MIVSSSAHLAFDCAANAWKQVTISKGSSGLTDSDLQGWGAGYMYDRKRNLIWMSDHYSDLYVARLDSATASVEDTEGSGKFSVSICPNPFNAATAINLNIPAKLKVNVHIYSINGKMVRSFFPDKFLKAGRHKLYWNGLDAYGHKVGCGVYVARFMAGKIKRQIRIIFLK